MICDENVHSGKKHYPEKHVLEDLRLFS